MGFFVLFSLVILFFWHFTSNQWFIPDCKWKRKNTENISQVKENETFVQIKNIFFQNQKHFLLVMSNRNLVAVNPKDINCLPLCRKTRFANWHKKISNHCERDTMVFKSSNAFQKMWSDIFTNSVTVSGIDGNFKISDGAPSFLCGP